MRILPLAAALLTSLMLAGCATHVIQTVETTGAAETEAPLPSPVVGTWSLGKGNVALILREDGTGAILALGTPDGEIFTELFYIGTSVRWNLTGERLTLTPLPDVLPNGAVCTTAASTVVELVSFDGETLLLTESSGEEPRTEMFVPAEEPPYYTVAEYAKTIADAKFAEEPEGSDRDAFYASFYEAFAAMYRSAAEN